MSHSEIQGNQLITDTRGGGGGGGGGTKTPVRDVAKSKLLWNRPKVVRLDGIRGGTQSSTDVTGYVFPETVYYNAEVVS